MFIVYKIPCNIMPKYAYYQLQGIYLSYFNRFKNLSSTCIRNTQTVKFQVIYLSLSLSRSQVRVVWPVICFVSFCTRPFWHSLITKIYSYSCTSSDLLDWIMCSCPWAVCHLPNTDAREVAAYARRSQLEWNKWDVRSRPAATNADWRKT